MLKQVFSAAPRWSQGLLLVRLGAGLLIAKHGLDVFDSAGMSEMAQWLGTEQHLPAPILLAYLAKGSEFFGGLLVALGLLTRPACVFLIVTMAVAAFQAHHGDVAGEGQPAFLYLLLFLGLFFSGPGPWSLDALVFDRRVGR